MPKKTDSAFIRILDAWLIRSCQHKTWLAGAILMSIVSTSSAQSIEADGETTEIDFAKQVVPLLTKAGCNSGACHGAAAGRAYLSLSLFGSRPRQDYETLLFASPGRFLDTQHAESSLLLQKPSGYLDHGGDVRLDENEAAYAIVRDWILDGAPRGSLADLQELSIAPSLSIECLVGQAIEISALAKWADGEQRSVTQWLVVEGAQPIAAENATLTYEHAITDDKSIVKLTPKASGYWPVTLRFGAVTKTLQLWVRSDGNSDGNSAASNSKAPTNVDEFVALANARIGAALDDACPPHLLARRLWIDLLGRQPTLNEWQSATDEIRSGHKAVLVDRLLASDDFFLHASHQLGNWVAGAGRIDRPAIALESAILVALKQSDDLKQLARDMLLVDEQTHALNAFHQFAGDPRARAELVASMWMGVRLGCAQCHDHPLDHWTQDDYFAMAACWAEIEPDGRGARRIPEQTTTDLRTGRPAIARLPGSSFRIARDSANADEAFVDWLCTDQNPQFARNLANRVWAWLIGSGLVEELDDHRDSNPAINSGLLTYLSASLMKHDYSLRSLAREIVLSDTYARSSRADASRIEQRLGAARAVKPILLPLEKLVSEALEVGLSEVTPLADADATMMVANESGCSRGQTCGDPLSESLELAAGKQLNHLLTRAVEKSWRPQTEPTKVLADFHQRLLGEDASEQEMQRWKSFLSTLRSDPQLRSTDENAKAVVEDIVWSWVVSDQFRLLH